MKSPITALLCLLLGFSACQPAPAPLPTLIPSLTASPSATPSPTLAARPSATLTEPPAPSQAAPLTISPAPASSFTPYPAPSATASAAPTLTPLPDQFRFGESVGGLPLVAHRLGTGPRVLLLVGGVHAGYEANTVRLLEELLAHYRAVPSDVAPHMTLILVTALNVDGLAAGRSLAGRWNANGVDLNRNWGCNWSAQAEYFGGAANPGAAPFSEPETQALGALIELVRPSAALFYHAAARGVFAGNCQGNVSQGLADVYGQAVGYPSDQAFSAYAVTGSAPAWLDSRGIPAADVELASSDQTEFTRHLRALRAVQDWLADQGSG